MDVGDLHFIVLAENQLLFWLYTLLGTVFLVLDGFSILAWYFHRGAQSGWMSILMLALSSEMTTRALIRSPYALVPDEAILHLGRIAAIVACGASIGLVDAYLASHNGHLDMVRRLLRWWDNRSQVWADMEVERDR